jgi:CubicO group peptidase (beta-lactamase class C family)
MTTRCQLRAACAVLALLCAFAPARAETQAKSPDKASLDALFADALKTWKAPGMAVVIVRDNDVYYLKGFGVREAGKDEPVTPDTLFGIGSLTKAFTATTLGVLVDDGKLSWDDPVGKHVPFFHLSDPLADRDVTIRDLLCHRTGLGRHDLLWYRAPWLPEESVRRMAFLKLSSSFRSTYEYCNLTYLVAGLAITSAAGEPWPDYMRKRLLAPLGMKRAVLTRSEAMKAADHATPHRFGAGDKPLVMEWYPDDRQVRASGSIKSCVSDLAGWLRVQLNGGKLGDRRVVPAAVLAETHRPQVVVPLDSDRARLAGTTLEGYGLGWHISDYRGQPLIEHGGAVDGFRARILLLPKQKVGAVLLTNVEESAVLSATGNVLLDLLLGAEAKTDWHAHYRAQVDRADRLRESRAQAKLRSKRPGTKPSHEPEAYVGDYEDAAYGKATVLLKDGDLRLSWSAWTATMKHFHHDTFELMGPGRLGDELVVFVLKADGSVGSLRLLGQEFKRVGN